jgi:hypothetical protein
MGRYWWVAALLLQACRTENDGFELDAPAPATRGDGGAAAESPNADAEPESSVQGAGGAPEVVRAGCGAEAVTLEELHSGRVRRGIPVLVSGLVASSQKFLLSEAKSGSCLWGAFAAADAKTGAGSGLLLVSFGAPHDGALPCASGSDALPDDLRPGDSLEVEGVVDEYAPAACDGVAPALQLRIDVACPVRRSASGAEPAPTIVDRALAARLAAGKEPQLLRDWSGALVTLDDVSALQDIDDGDAVFPFGVIRLEQTPLEVHSRLYYFDLSEGGPRSSAKSPHLSYPWRFERVTGLVFLDYCSWVLAPRDRCLDVSPAGDDCAHSAG